MNIGEELKIEEWVAKFNGYKITVHCRDNNVPVYSLTEDEKKFILQYVKGPLDIGALFDWKRESGGFINTYGFGIMMHEQGSKFIMAHNSKKLGRIKFTMLDPQQVCSMIEWGEVRYLGNILNPDFRKKYDMEKISLAVCGFLSAFNTVKLNQETSVDDVLNKLDTGEMTLEQMLKKAGSDVSLWGNDQEG